MAVTVNIPVASINVGDRRREDYGDIEALAASIKDIGLLHPIVVDIERNLVAGGRRLAAIKMLNLQMVAVRMIEVATPARLRLIELEENTRRKDLTRDELLRAFDEAKQVLRDLAVETAPEPVGGIEGDESPQLDLLDGPVQKIGRGRPERPDSDAKAAAVVGVPLPTIKDAKRDAAAEGRYPVLKGVPTQGDRLKIAAKLDAMPESVRAEALERIARRDSETLTTLTDRPPVPKGPTPHEMAANDPERKWAQAITAIREKLHAAQHHGGIGHLTRKWSDAGKRDYLRQVRQIRAELGEWEEYLAGEVEHDEHVA